MAEWDKTVLDAIDSVVDTATNKVVTPAHKLARMSVYGTVVATLACICLFFVVIAAFRATTIAMPVYAAYFVWGGIFTAVGALLWSKK